MKSINLVENGEVLAVGIFFGNAEETAKEIRSGTPVNNIVQTITRDSGEIETSVLAEKYFLWSSREFLQNVIDTYPVRYSKHGNVLTLVESSDTFVRFEYAKYDDTSAIVTVEIVPVDQPEPTQEREYQTMNTYQHTSTENLIAMREEAHNDSLALIWSNPAESDKLGKLVFKIDQELENRKVGLSRDLSQVEKTTDDLSYTLSYVKCSACGHNSKDSKYVEDGRGFCVLCGGTIVGEFEEGTISPETNEYLACWIESADDAQEILDKLSGFSIEPTVVQHSRGDGVSIRYILKATEIDMLQWRACLKSHGIDPFYVHAADGRTV